jgi:hypothetical protein
MEGGAMNLSIRFYVGLATSLDPNPGALQADIRATHVRDILSGAYDGFTSWRGTGAWKGQTEPCLVVEVLVTGAADPACPGDADCDGAEAFKARAWAGRIARALGQESVLVTFQPVETEFVGP